MSAAKFSVGGPVHPRFRIEHGRIFVWGLRGSGGATPVARTLDYRRHRTNWMFRRNVFMWPCYGSGGAVVATTAAAFWHLHGGFGRHSLNGRGYSQ